MIFDHIYIKEKIKILLHYEYKGTVILVELDVRRSARIVYSKQLGLHMLIGQTGIGSSLCSARFRYKLPLTSPDTISVGAEITVMADDSSP